MKVKELLTEQNNETLCAIRVIGFIGVGLLGAGLVLGAAPAEIGLGVAAIIGSIGGALRLKGDGNHVDT